MFKKLEELRGVSRKNKALSLAIQSLEDHASDLARRQQKRADAAQAAAERKQKDAEEAAAKRGRHLNFLLSMTGVFGAGQMFYWIGEKAAGGEGKDAEPARQLFGLLPSAHWAGNLILSLTEGLMTVALILFFVHLGRWGYAVFAKKG